MKPLMHLVATPGLGQPPPPYLCVGLSPGVQRPGETPPLSLKFLLGAQEPLYTQEQMECKEDGMQDS